MLTRVAASHLRVGTFQFFATRGTTEKLKTLADYTIARHDPALADQPQPYLALLRAVTERQAALIARWMGVGFIHGVMNTDNMTISGETIDYGPCAFMDAYDPATVFSSIDHQGRYAYGNQPGIAQWNLARLAETLLPLLDDDADTAVALATEVVKDFPALYQQHWLAELRRKLGLAGEQRGRPGAGQRLAGPAAGPARGLHAGVPPTRRTRPQRRLPPRCAPCSPNAAPLDAWLARWQARSAAGQAATRPRAPKPCAWPTRLYIPRNHLVEAALSAAVEQGDQAPFERLLAVLQRPFDDPRGPGRTMRCRPAPRPWPDTGRFAAPERRRQRVTAVKRRVRGQCSFTMTCRATV